MVEFTKKNKERNCFEREEIYKEEAAICPSHLSSMCRNLRKFENQEHKTALVDCTHGVPCNRFTVAPQQDDDGKFLCSENKRCWPRNN
jgi:hypothetical protein